MPGNDARRRASEGSWLGCGTIYRERLTPLMDIEKARTNRKTPSRGFRRLARVLASAFVTFGAAFSATAVACLCASSDLKPVEHDEVFSGLIIATERTDEPVADASYSGDKVVEDPGYWARSRILVIRTWRGAPSTVADVWTPVVTDCDSPPIAGSYFVALVRSENGRGVASNSPCDDAQKAEATKQGGGFAVAGIAITAGVLGAATVALLPLVKIIRRRRSPR